MTAHVFVYGRLQQPELRRWLFGIDVPARPDQLVGYRMASLAIIEAAIVAVSALAEHPLIEATDDPFDYVDGTVLELTEDQLATVDAYEFEDYARKFVRLGSGQEAWVYTC